MTDTLAAFKQNGQALATEPQRVYGEHADVSEWLSAPWWPSTA